MCHNSFTGRSRKNRVIKSNNTTRRDCKLKESTVTLRFHHSHFPLTACYHVNNLTCAFLWKIDHKLLYWLTLNAINFADNYLRLSNLKLITLTAHSLDKDRQVKYATPINKPAISSSTSLYAKSEIAVKFLL